MITWKNNNNRGLEQIFCKNYNNRRLKLKKNIVIFIIAIAVVFLFPCVLEANEIDYEYDEQTDITVDTEVRDISIPKVTAKCAVGVDSETGRILFEKNAHVKMEMASTTKIMTAIIAIEKDNLDDLVTISGNAANIWGSDIGVKRGEQWPLRSLLYGLMLKSGNDAAIAIAEHIAGSTEQFLKLMNEKAIEIGAVNTCFKSPHGLDIEGHYSTAYDLSIITKYAFQNPIFNEIVNTRQIIVKGPKGNVGFTNINEMLSLYKGADGVKTGYTGKAGRCLVSSATRDNFRVISVVLGCSSRNNRASDSSKILNYSFDNYKLYTLIDESQEIGEIYISKGVDKYCKVRVTDTVKYVLDEDELFRLEVKYGLPNKVEAPISAGQKIGEMLFCLDDNIVGQTDIVADEFVDKKGLGYYFSRLFEFWMPGT